MSKRTTKTLAPKLRFPEFRDAGEWEEKRLEEVASFSKGKGISKSDVTVDGKQPCIRYGELYTLYNETIEKVSSYTNVSANNLVLSKANDVIIPASGETQEDIATASCVIKTGIALGGDLNIIRSKMNGVFLSYYLNSAKKKSISQLAQGISVVHLYPSQLKNLSINSPDLPEQQKIADCLSSIDKLITAHSQKHEALKAHKKGLMQQLFPAIGETIPKLRFPEFRDAGEWNISTIGEIALISSGGTPSRAKKDYWSGKIPWVTTTLIDFNTIGVANEYITKVGLKNSSAKILPKNTILMAMYGQGKTRGKVAILGAQAAINQACAAITLKKGINTEFVFQNLASRYDEIRRISNQGGQENLSGTLIKKIPFTYPNAQTNEQQKIADCLSSIDDLITAQAKKIESLKAHKKGLMQQLFPAVDEVNG